MRYVRGDSFPFDFEPNGFPFDLKSKGKLSPLSYPIPNYFPRPSPLPRRGNWIEDPSRNRLALNISAKIPSFLFS